uniref:Uncharacterized protein n=1 Tax=Ananas comosus var. bracteatus TaxID=296719 RepID=A0A6V7QVU9_ANACO
MKCPSVACLWPSAPPPHRVTAAASASASASAAAALYSGGSDGSLVWWDLSDPEIRPVALLCGHAAPIADLAPCFPSAAAPSILSACSDGVLCVWSGAGRCRRRRKLPPWAGAPSLLAPLPLTPRRVCVVCSSADAAVPHPNEDGEEASTKRSTKCNVLIVDSCTLNVVQTVFHSYLRSGPYGSGGGPGGGGQCEQEA